MAIGVMKQMVMVNRIFGWCLPCMVGFFDFRIMLVMIGMGARNLQRRSMYFLNT